jgi:hypothetical protein
VHNFAQLLHQFWKARPLLITTTRDEMGPHGYIDDYGRDGDRVFDTECKRYYNL